MLGNRALVATSVFLMLMPLLTAAATMRLAPSSVSVATGDTVSVSVMLTSSDQAMNAAQGVIKFPPNLLQVAALSKGGSVLGLWVQEPSFSNAAGTVNFEGVALNPGFVGTNGTVLTVTFRTKAEGEAELSLIGASVLANDGNGTEILTGTSGSVVSITSAPVREIQPPPKPLPKPVEKEVPAPPPVQVPVITEVPPVSQKITLEKPYDPWRLWVALQRSSDTLLPILVLIFFVLDGALLMIFLETRKRRARAKMDHVQIITHRSFLSLRGTIDAYVSQLEESAGKRKLTAVDTRFAKTIRGDLSNAEKAIITELIEHERSEH